MINYIWFFMIAIGVLVGIINGRMAEVSKAIIDSAQTAVAISIGLVGVMSLWLGIMKIADKSGLTDIIAKLLKPIIIRLFPDVPKDHPAISAMIMNISANMLGLGNAATPFGIKAMEYLQELNKKRQCFKCNGPFFSDKYSFNTAYTCSNDWNKGFLRITKSCRFCDCQYTFN